MLKLTDPLLTRAESKAISVFRLRLPDGLYRWHTLPLSSDEAAAYLGMKPEAPRNACHARRVTYARLNYRTWRFTKADLDNFISRYTFPAKTLSES